MAQSKMVLDLVRESEKIAALAESQAESASAELERRYKRHVPRGAAVDWDTVFRALAAALRADAQAALAADAAHEQELLDDDEPRAARDESAAQLYAGMVDAREAVTGVYGAATTKKLGFDGPVPQDPTRLAEAGVRVASNARTIKPAKARIPGARLDLDAIADSLTAPLTTLSAALKAVTREQREAQATVAKKGEAVKALEDSVYDTGRLLEGLLGRASQRAMADRVRSPGIRRDGEDAEGGEGGEPKDPEKKDPEKK